MSFSEFHYDLQNEFAAQRTPPCLNIRTNAYAIERFDKSVKATLALQLAAAAVRWLPTAALKRVNCRVVGFKLKSNSLRRLAGPYLSLRIFHLHIVDK